MYEGTNTTLNPWRSIWLQPRATIRQIVTTDPERHVIALVAANSVAGVLTAGSMLGEQNKLGLFAFLLVALVMMPIFAVIVLYLGAMLLRLTGRWLGGVAPSRDLRAALAWGCIPSLVVNALLVIAMLVPGLNLFPTPPPELRAHPFQLATYGPGSTIQNLAGLWAFVTILKCVAEVQGFSAWKALGNYLLAAVVAAGGVIAVVVVASVVAAMV